MTDTADVKPLHVRVAEALGCKPYFDAVWCCRCAEGAWEDGPHVGAERFDTLAINELAHYDEDWSATGPLIEKYEVTVKPVRRSVEDTPPWWEAWHNESAHGGKRTLAPTPLIAVCHLLVELGKEGKLER